MNGKQPDARTVFIAALELNTPEARTAYLDETCRDNPELRQRVEKLLRAHEQANEFLEVEESDGIIERPGTIVDHYKLLEEIGEGGFGVVFMAEQVEPIRRRVALKVVKPGMDTKQVIARFEAERQALALMDHPGIAHVFDAGSTETGRPYFVMELVCGVPITKYCDDNELSPNARLQLFIAVCEAVQHAHQKGIIHRDLKPSNILVTLHDGKPVPKVIDFGTAKALQQPLTEKTMFTAYGKLVGTPQYMSPEQAEMSGLDVDTRADIYSLGVLLYELLTGTTPFEPEQLRAAAFDEMMRLIRQEDPPKPSTRVSSLGERCTDIARNRQVNPDKLRRTLHGDLDWIIMKALEKSRQRRYDTAIAFAQDLKCHLGHEPVSAGQPSMAYRSRKFLRRHRTASLVVAVISISLIAGVIVSSIGLVRATREADRANAEAERARQQEATAEAIFLFIQNDLLREQSMTSGGGMDDIPLHTAIDWAANGIDRRFSGQPMVQIRIHQLLADFYSGQLDFQKSFEHAEQASQLAAQHLEPSHPYRVEADQRLLWSYIFQQRHADAEQHIKHELEAAEKTYGTEHLNTAVYLENLAGLYMYQQDITVDLGVLGKSKLFENTLPGRFDKAESLYQRAAEIRENVLGPEHPDALMNLLFYYAAQGENGKVVELAERTLKIREKALGPEDPAVADILDILAEFYEKQEKPEEAEQHLKRALEIRRTAFGEEDLSVAKDLFSLARLYDSQGKFDQAEPLYEQDLQIRENIYGADHPETIVRRSSLARFYGEHGQVDKSEQLYKRHLEITEKTLGMEQHWTQVTINLLTDLYKTRGKYAEAGLLYKRDLESREKKLELAQSGMVHSLQNLASAYNMQRKYTDAVSLLERALEIQENLGGPDTTTVLGLRNDLAGNLFKQGHYDEAESQYGQVLKIVNQKPYNPGGPWPQIYYGTDAMGGMALTYIEVGKYEEAEPLLGEAQELLDRHISFKKPETTPFLARKMTFNLNAYATLYLAQNQYEEAEACLNRALEIWGKVPGPDHPDMVPILESTAILYHATERNEEAEALEQRAERICNVQYDSN